MEVDLGGVRTWYAVDGAGEPLVYLHGGFSDADELEPVRAQYAARIRVYSPDRRGHGRTPDVEELGRVRARTLVVCGDDDVIALEPTLELYRGIPDAELAVVPGTSHVLIGEKPQLVARLVLDFLTTEPMPTRAPIRRR